MVYSAIVNGHVSITLDKTQCNSLTSLKNVTVLILEFTHAATIDITISNATLVLITNRCVVDGDIRIATHTRLFTTAIHTLSYSCGAINSQRNITRHGTKGSQILLGI